MTRTLRVQARILLAVFTVLLGVALATPQSLATPTTLAGTVTSGSRAASGQERNADCYPYNYDRGEYHYYRYCYHYRYRENRRYYYRFSLYYYYRDNRNRRGECSYRYSGDTHPSSPYREYCER